MSRRVRRALVAEGNREQRAQPAHLVRVPVEQWPERRPAGLVDVWRSRLYFVQVYAEQDGAERLSIVRAERIGRDWADGIRWEELQAIKRQIGRGHQWAVEIFPNDAHVVNVANMRHLWLLPEAPVFGWQNEGAGGGL